MLLSEIPPVAPRLLMSSISVMSSCFVVLLAVVFAGVLTVVLVVVFTPGFTLDCMSMDVLDLEEPLEDTSGMTSKSIKVKP